MLAYLFKKLSVVGQGALDLVARVEHFDLAILLNLGRRRLAAKLNPFADLIYVAEVARLHKSLASTKSCGAIFSMLT